ncbi:MAG: flagellar biosynthetic protein FliR [Lachnospiraceae bacterium]|nr:flagellar biosynthetic protein FliR [Lachnospiraceae bacterium]
MNVEITFSQANLEYYLLILVRMASFVYISPFFGQNNVPQRVKLGLSLFLAFIVYSILPKETLEYTTTLGYAELVVRESIAGLLIGFSAYICNTIILFAGKLIDMQIGLAMANLFDPITRTQVSVTGNMYQYILLLLLIATGMYSFLLSAIVDSYSIIEIGGMHMTQTLYENMMGFMVDYFVIGFRINLPIFAIILILDCAMGIMTKVASQIHMFSVGMQIKILGGFLILFLTVFLLPDIANFIFVNMQDMVIATIRGMR